MKYSSLQSFEKHLEGAAPSQHFADVYMILSKDRFLRKMALDRLNAALLGSKQKNQFAIKVLDASTANPELLAEEMATFSLFDTRKLLIVEADQADKLPKSMLQAIDQFCKYPNRAITLIVSANSVNASSNFYKQVEKAGILLDFPEEKGVAKEKTLSSWIMAQVAAQHKKIDAQACHYLLKHVTTDPSTLHQEVDKLITYIGDRPSITLQDIKAICAYENSETIWQLGEALFRRDASAALRIAKGLLQEGSSFLHLLRQIRHQFQTDFQVGSILASGGNASHISQKFPYMKGFILDKHMQTAQSYGLTNFKRAMLLIDEMELKAKNSSGSDEYLTDLLICKLLI